MWFSAWFLYPSFSCTLWFLPLAQVKLALETRTSMEWFLMLHEWSTHMLELIITHKYLVQILEIDYLMKGTRYVFVHRRAWRESWLHIGTNVQRNTQPLHLSYTEEQGRQIDECKQQMRASCCFAHELNDGGNAAWAPGAKTREITW